MLFRPMFFQCIASVIGRHVKTSAISAERGASLFAVVLLPALFLAGCVKEQVVEEQVVRPVRAAKVGDFGQIAGRTFPSESLTFRDEQTGARIRQVTAHPSVHHHPFFHVPCMDDTMQRLVLVSHRAGRPEITLVNAVPSSRASCKAARCKSLMVASGVNR